MRSSVVMEAMNGVLSLAAFGRRSAVDSNNLKTRKVGGEGGRQLKQGEQVVRMARSKHRNKLAAHNAKLQQQFNSVRPSSRAARGRGGGANDGGGDGGDGGDGDDGDGDGGGDDDDGGGDGVEDSRGGDGGGGDDGGLKGSSRKDGEARCGDSDGSGSQSLPPAQTLPSPFAQLFQYRPFGGTRTDIGADTDTTEPKESNKDTPNEDTSTSEGSLAPDVHSPSCTSSCAAAPASVRTLNEEAETSSPGIDGGDQPPSRGLSSPSVPSERAASPDVLPEGHVPEGAAKGRRGSTRMGSLSKLRRSIADTLIGKSDSGGEAAGTSAGTGRKKSPSRRFIYKPFPAGAAADDEVPSTPTGQSHIAAQEKDTASAGKDGGDQPPSPLVPSERATSPDGQSEEQASPGAAKGRTGGSTRFGSLSKLRRSIVGKGDSRVSNISSPVPRRFLYKPKAGGAEAEDEVPSTPKGQSHTAVQEAGTASSGTDGGDEPSAGTDGGDEPPSPLVPSERAASPDVRAEAQESVQELAARVAMKDTVAKSKSPWMNREVNTKRRLQKHPSLLNLHQDHLVQSRRAKFADLRRSVAKRMSLRASVASKEEENLDRASSSTTSPGLTSSFSSTSSPAPTHLPPSTPEGVEDAYDA